MNNGWQGKNHKKTRAFTALLTAAVLLFCLAACGESASAATSATSAPARAVSIGSTPAVTPAGAGTSGSGNSVFRDAVFHKEKAEGNSEVLVDLSALQEGYVALHCISDAKIKFQVIKDDLTVTYSVVCGKDQVFPLQSGDGHYNFRVMKNIVDKKYAELYQCEADVKITDPFDPFLRPNQYANYTQTSDCVKQAAEMAKTASGQEEFVRKVYDYVTDNITYDDYKAETVQSGYLPDPDLTMKEKKGICFDYACLAASMLRSQGVPTKIIFGYVAPDDLYHAWNMFYSEKDGWTLVEFKVSGRNWNRIDLTFSANGADNSFIGNGTNYVDAYTF